MGMIRLFDQSSTLIPEKLDIGIIDEPMMVRARMLKDRPELAVLPMNMAAILWNKGVRYQVVAVPVWGTLYLAGTDSTLVTWEQLRNRKVNLMGKGTTPDILFRCLLKKHGLEPDRDVQLDYSFPTHIDLANAVIAGKAEIAVLSEPLVTLARERNPRIGIRMDLNREWASAFPELPRLPQTAFLGREDFIRQHPGWVRTIADAWSASIDSLNDDPAPYLDKIVTQGILPSAAIARKSIPGSNLAFSYASDIRPMIMEYLRVFYTFNPDAVGGKLPDEEFICEIPAH